MIPANWGKLLADIQAVCPSAVIAGGCLRDLDNDKPIKDIDVFINSRTMGEAADDIARLTDAGFDVNFELAEGSAYPEDQNLEVVALGSMGDCDGLPVQIIFVNWATAKIVERFDYGICKLSFDGGAVIKPLDYIDDKNNRVFRLRRDRPTPISMRGSIRRYARLTAEKYQGWDFWPYEPPCSLDVPCN